MDPKDRKHTPLPWAQHRTSEKTYANVRGAGRYGYGRCVADCGSRSDDTAQANAEFIALACNSHYQLVEALEAMVSAGLTQFDRGTHKIGLDNVDLLAKARAALASAAE